MNNVNPLSAIKMHLKRYMLKSSDAICLLALLTYVIVEANSVNQHQQHSVSSLFDPEALKTLL